MGSEQSKIKRLEQQMLSLRDSVQRRFRHDKWIRVSHGVANVMCGIFALLIVPWTLMRAFLLRNLPFMEQVSQLRKCEFLLLAGLLTLWAGCTFLLNWTQARNLESIENDRQNLVKVVERYEARANVVRIRRALKDIGKGDVTLEDFAAVDIAFPARRLSYSRGSITARISEAIVGGGPDRLCAVICPSCHTHNGLVSPDQVDTVVYDCSNCEQRIKGGKVQVEESSDSDSVEEDLSDVAQ